MADDQDKAQKDAAKRVQDAQKAKEELEKKASEDSPPDTVQPPEIPGFDIKARAKAKAAEKETEEEESAGTRAKRR